MADEVDETDDDQPGEIDEEDLEGLAEEDLIDDDEIDDEAVLEDDAAVVDEEDPEKVAAAAAAKKAADDAQDEEDELEVDHDVEATLDEILKERLVVVEEEEEDDEPVDRDDQTDSGKVPPKRPDEFVCQSCFLVKHPSQLADAKRQYCRDCV